MLLSASKLSSQISQVITLGFWLYSELPLSDQRIVRLFSFSVYPHVMSCKAGA